LRSPALYEALAAAEPLTPVVSQRATETQPGTWKVLGGKGNTIRVRLAWNDKTNDRNLEFLSEDRFRYATDVDTVFIYNRVR
jgi:hypothetical protein